MAKKQQKMKNPKRTYFEVVSPERAKEFYKSNREIYKMYPDGTEALIESLHELHDAIDLGIELAIENLIS